MPEEKKPEEKKTEKIKEESNKERKQDKKFTEKAKESASETRKKKKSTPAVGKDEPSKHKIPELGPGHTVRIHQRIKEGDKERVQVFEGIILAIKGKTTITRTITVYKLSQGIGVEKIFPLALPTITKIEVIKKARVRRAKLYYLKNYKKRIKEEKVAQSV